jgi:tetratricopeptide (TPR) repeat protein
MGKPADAAKTLRDLERIAPKSAPAAQAKLLLPLMDPSEDAAAGVVPLDGLEDKRPADGKHLVALLSQAAQLKRQGQRREAIAAYEGVLDIVPGIPLAQLRLAELYLEEPGLSGKANPLIASLDKIRPDDPDVARLLGEAALQRGDSATAVRQLQRSDRAKPLPPRGVYLLGLALAEQGQASSARAVFQRMLRAELTDALRAAVQQTLNEMDSTSRFGGPVRLAPLSK